MWGMDRDFEQYILSNFHKAIEARHIRPYYQPVVRTMSRQLCSMEALARWVDPTCGVIQPDQFIPVLEAHRLIHELDACIIRQVCVGLRRAANAGKVSIPVSVNLSRLDFMLCDIFAVVDGIATQYQIPHGLLYIEITESIFAENEALLRDSIERFRAAGYQVWMDDFGSGYSSLNILKDFEFDELKLDMRFLSSFSQRSRRILSSVIQMAKEIDVHTLAEGVETEEQFRYLRNTDCEKAQGYYFGRPMPFDDLMEHLKREGIEVEKPQERRYWDDIGRINLLSSVPFMSRAERDTLTTARQLNSIPLAIVEVRGNAFSILFYNTAFENTAVGTGLVANLFTQELLRVPQPLSALPARVINLMDDARSGEEGRMHFISKDEYYEIQAKRIAETRGAYSVLLRMSNLSKASRAKSTTHLDEGLRQLYTLYDRVTLLDTAADTITPLYVGTKEDVLSGRTGIHRLAEEYAEKWIFPDDRQEYLRLVDPDTLEERVRRAGKTNVSHYFRTYIRHGQYGWKQYTLLRLRANVYAELIRNVHTELLAFETDLSASVPGAGGFTPALLWKNLIQSDIARIFWKDAERRFLGASRGFLDYYGFPSAAAIVGKNDEDLGWHLHPESYMNDEIRVIHEGLRTHNVPGRCIRQGENRDIIASKTPLYDENGEIKGLLGCFIDRDLLNINDSRGAETKRRDMMTGLLNSRGISEEARSFEDEYNLRGIDFARIHVAIDDIATLNRQFGFDFGDKAITALGKALKESFGVTSAVGRYTGHEFVVLHQLRGDEGPHQLRDRIKGIAGDLRQVDGVALTLYLSVGIALYSEFGSVDEQTQKAEARLLADHDEHTSAESRQARASELFHLYDGLPISFAVYKAQTDRATGQSDVTMFYCNRLFEERAGMKMAEMVGRGTRELFPAMGEDWYDKALRAALLGETIVDKLYYPPTGKHYYMTASQVIRRGYCSFTYQEWDKLDERVLGGME